ncbi:MAG: SpoIIE family protein phosphatase [Pirellulaceae bacterium]|jgi:serine phosphatase RsbU (regulator of sigma subunit)|nr:SpoIIE family protein phosphatase [Pirellulaceae bacterium]
MAHLRSSGNPKSIHPITLRGEQEEFVVGRHPECSLVIDAASISRRHARLTCLDGEYFVQDLQSRNSTYLNGVRVDPEGGPQPLKDQDKLGFCDLEFVFHMSDAPSPEGGILFVDDDADSSNSTIMSKVGVSSAHGALQLTASPEAKLNALLEITRNLGRALALDDVLPQVLNSLFKIFVQADRGFIALRNPDGTLVPRWSRAWREDTTETIRVSRTIVTKVMETQEAILSADVMMDEEFNKAQSIADFRIRSMMCAPLIDSLGNSMGVLQIDTVKQSKRFQQEDLEVLLAVAAQAGIAIDNAQMHETALRQRVIERDLTLANEVQQGFLPDSRPDVPGYEFFDFYRPALQIGGDYFDYLRLPDGRLAVIVADVVGKGVAAALLMAKLSAEARFCLASGGNAADAISMLNGRLCRMHLDRFVTAVLVLLDAAAHEVSIANAGHMAPLLRTRQGRVVEPGADVTGLPLGILEDLRYEAASVRLAAGDTLTLYTDGLNDAVNAEGQFYTIERIRRQVAAVDGRPTVIGQTLVKDVCDFIGQGVQSDDMCLVTLGRIS